MTGLLRDARSAFHAVRAWSGRRGRRLAALAVAAGWMVALTAIAAPSAADAATAAPAPPLAPASVLAPAAPGATAPPPALPGPAPPAVPGPPSGWSTVFSDDFNGAAGSAPSGSWQYDTGPGSSFGTGEIETMTNSPSNVHLDGNGNLDITALGQGSSWTSGRIQTTTANVGAPAGGELEVTA